MKRVERHRDEKLGRLKIVKDFLPPPNQLVLRDDGVKVRRVRKSRTRK